MNTAILVRHPNVYRLIRRVSRPTDLLSAIMPLGWLWFTGRGPWPRAPWRNWMWWIGWAVLLAVLLSAQVGIGVSLVWATILWVATSVAFVGRRATKEVRRWFAAQARQVEDAQIAEELSQMGPVQQQATPAQPISDPDRLQG